MSTLLTAMTATIAALATATVLGAVINRRSGVLRQASPELRQDTSELGLSRTGPTIVHFSAAWCGPCASVRRVVDQVCTALPEVSHVEIDIDADPVAAKQLSVLSLPTTFIFDADGQQRYRSAGVPKVADLRRLVQPLVA
ncbi:MULTISPECIES: thioredoxin family protein [unclassified Mycobacterium]|uniref:thioredoxin family protein n=1 Tax=unclassified Mycobacterium TaxID=2642494 RepID=UPI0007FD7365|nr:MULTISPECIES: thioredoxin family protein [unclassified Mycobacterium]OBH04568.1 thiol reductase thioredoxin [Mycobacterium sp. E2699]OBI54176.1 thiol reductase thioredoxin [Mycobacterium sp. E787]